LDYTKGIPQQLEAIEEFLERFPEWSGKVLFALVVVPSRERVVHYAALKREVDEQVGRINSRYGTLEWMPVWYIYRSLPFEELVAFYATAHVALVAPLRDGLNLIAKEYVASRPSGSGVLVLSDTAGASKELLEALIVNPNSKEDVANALHRALTMPREEQRRRIRLLQGRLKRHTVRQWAGRFLKELEEAAQASQAFAVRFLDAEEIQQIRHAFQRARRRLLLLDYDGTLSPFFEDPIAAVPTTAILNLLTQLSALPGTRLVLLSGRDQETLDDWFGNLDSTLVAEHGAWVKRPGRAAWRPVRHLDSSWKRQLRPILERFVDQIPGSIIEEKSFALVWHYRKADPESSADAAKELVDILTHLTANWDLHVMAGSKVVEVKSPQVSKGAFYRQYLAPERHDFILALGDDQTDESLFSALPKNAYSIRVGEAASAARFNVESVEEAVALLQGLAAEDLSDPRRTSRDRRRP
jgi:trehalose 6-phosphate synthase/phosphatase